MSPDQQNRYNAKDDDPVVEMFAYHLIYKKMIHSSEINFFLFRVAAFGIKIQILGALIVHPKTGSKIFA